MYFVIGWLVYMVIATSIAYYFLDRVSQHNKKVFDAKLMVHVDEINEIKRHMTDHVLHLQKLLAAKDEFEKRLKKIESNMSMGKLKNDIIAIKGRLKVLEGKKK